LRENMSRELGSLRYFHTFPCFYERIVIKCFVSLLTKNILKSSYWTYLWLIIWRHCRARLSHPSLISSIPWRTSGKSLKELSSATNDSTLDRYSL
jgi:hypothetical protein